MTPSLGEHEERRIWLYLPDKEVFDIIVEILDIEEEPENKAELHNWIDRSGIEYVFKKVLEINMNLL